MTQNWSWMFDRWLQSEDQLRISHAYGRDTMCSKSVSTVQPNVVSGVKPNPLVTVSANIELMETHSSEIFIPWILVSQIHPGLLFGKAHASKKEF